MIDHHMYMILIIYITILIVLVYQRPIPYNPLRAPTAVKLSMTSQSPSEATMTTWAVPWCHAEESHGIPRKWPVGIPHVQTWLGSKIPRENLWNPMFTTISPPYPHQIHRIPLYLPMKITIIHPKIPEITKKKTQFPAAREEASHERSIKFTSWGWNAKMWGYMAWDNRLTIQYWGRMGILGYNFTCGKMCKSDYVFHCCQKRVAKKIPHWS